MVIHNRGLHHLKLVGKHPMFTPPTWRVVLSCFSEMEAVHLDTVYGCHQLGWIVRERITQIPCKYSWLSAATSQSIGMMIYLMNYKVPCPDLDDLIQYAVDHNHMRILHLLMCDDHTFYDGFGAPIKTRSCPTLDEACTKGYVRMVYTILSTFSSKYNHKLLVKPMLTITTVMSKGLDTILRALVPRLSDIKMTQGLKLAAQENHTTTFRFALDHLNKSSIPFIPESIFITAAERGHTKIIQHCVDVMNSPCPLKAFNAAFTRGHMSTVRYILGLHPEYIPSESVLIETCRNGSNKILKALPINIRITNKCLMVACKGMSSKLIYTLHKRLPNFVFKKSMLTEAIQSGHSGVVLAVFECGGFSDLTLNMKVNLVTKSCRRALCFFHELGLTVYTVETLLEAARICQGDIIEDMVNSGLNTTSKQLNECVRKLYVSDATTRERGRAFTLLTRVRKGIEGSSREDATRSDFTRVSKRAKYVHHQSRK
jgi:hypothetical protein